MKIRILTIGQKMPAWVLTGFEDYFKRIQPFVQTQIIELPMAKRGKNDSEADILKLAEAWRPWRGYATVNLWNYLKFKGEQDVLFNPL